MHGIEGKAWQPHEEGTCTERANARTCTSAHGKCKGE